MAPAQSPQIARHCALGTAATVKRTSYIDAPSPAFGHRELPTYRVERRGGI